MTDAKPRFFRRFWKHGSLIFGMMALLALAYLWYLSYYANGGNNPMNNRYTDQEIQQRTAQANAYFEQYFDQALRFDPEWKAYLGIHDEQAGDWTPLTEEHAQARLQFQEKSLQYLRDSIDPFGLDESARLSYRILEYRLQREIEAFAYRHYNYPVHSMRGVHTSIPSLLQDMQVIKNEQDIQYFLKRITGIAPQIEQLLAQLQLREEKGIALPQLLFPKVIETTENLLKGFPLDSSKSSPHPIYTAFQLKLDSLPTLTATQKEAYLNLCQEGLRQSFQPAYQRLLDYLRQAEQRAPQEIGVWRLPDGDAYYAWLVRYVTTSQLSPEDIHEIGLREVERIHGEMRKIIQQVGFQGDLPAFFAYMRDSDTFYYDNTAEGKAAFLADTRQIIDRMRPRLPELFHTLPKAALDVRAVEAYEEKSAGKAFYRRGTADGSRPGVYFVNTYDMRQVPNYQMEALAYHEAIPGHHHQLSIAQELTDIPRFRRYGDYTAYIEGWGLYAELLGKEMGFYQNPYSDFGRLAMELWRAGRLVVDTGIHFKRWSREKALQFYRDNTPNSEIDCSKMVDRHIAMPGQAVAYKIGMITLLELRSKAQQQLGKAFDLRDFHDVVLRNGAVPLTILEDLVDAYMNK